MTTDRKELIRALLKGIETGDPESVRVVNPEKYIQHNPQTREGGEGLAALFKRLAKSNPRVNIVRAFEDGDFVFAHTEYDFASRRIGFEIFRFEGNQAVEHWDNIQQRRGPNPSGHSMVSGPADSTDHHLTENNRERIRLFVANVLIGGDTSQLDRYVSPDLVQHDPDLKDGSTAFRDWLDSSENQVRTVQWVKNHRLLAEGDFVLAANEGYLSGDHCAFFNLFRLSENNIVEHWNTIEKIAPRSEWKNQNGKF